MNKIYIFLLVFLSLNLSAQIQPLTKQTINEQEIQKVLQDKITEYEIIKLPVNRFLETLSDFDGPQEIVIEVNDQDVIPLQVVPEHNLVEYQKVHLASDNSVADYPVKVFPFKGYVQNGNAHARLTIAEDFFYMYIQGDGFSRYIEPLRMIIPGADPDLYISYYGNRVVYPKGNFCASNQAHQAKKSFNVPQKSSQMGECFEVEIALASDFLMYQKYNSSIDDVIARNVGVMNNVQGNYDDEFADEVQFVIVEQYISDCSTCDPWSSSTDVDVLLPNFRNWGPAGFSETHDLGHLWSDRDFDGTTIGYAYVGVVCSNSRYAILQDFSNNAAFIRVLTSHETGHNFSATHDNSGDPFIMAPAVSSATDWSTNSIGQIEGHYNSRTCLAECSPPAPPVSDFTANLTELCPGTTIHFFDQTENNPETWNWTFIGGSPSSSSLQNPIVTYDNPGTYNVTLETTNPSGGDSETKNAYITVGPDGNEFLISDDFVNDLNNWTITNPDNGQTWEVINAEGSSGNNSVAWMNNFEYQTGFNQVDGLVSPVLDFTGRASINLEVEYAYARYNANNNDRFRILASTDGGNSYTVLLFDGFETGGGNFATVPDNTSAFTPTSASEWCLETTYGPECISLDLSSLSNKSEIVIRMENISGYGNNLYIDNVNLTASCAVIEPPVANFTSNLTSGCAPLVVDFQDLSTNGPDSWMWSFPGGDPISSTEQNPTVVYETPGVYPVTLIAGNEAGSQALSVPGYVTVLGLPTAEFSSATNENTVEFTNESTDGDSYSWDFGDGQSSSQENPIHVYTEDGVFEVELTVTNLCGSVTFTETIEISTAPFANFSQDVNSGCASFEVQFTNESSSNSDSYEWTFEGGEPSSSTEENPVVMYSTRGVYNVVLVATNEQGSNSYSLESAVQVDDVPETSFDFTIDENTVTFNNTTQFGDSYMWDFGDGNTSTEVNPTHTYDSDQVYEVSLTATNECGMFTLNENVSISNLPFASFASNTTSGCPDLTVEFMNNSSSNSESFMWTFEGGNPSSSTEENPVVVYSTPGTYSVQLVATNGEGSNEAIQENYITVLEQPTALFDFTDDDLSFMFNNQSTSGNTYSWNFGDGNTSTEENPSHTYMTEGDYVVVLTVSNECGDVNHEISVSAFAPVVSDFTTNVTSGCADLTVEFTNSSSANSTGFQWTFPGGNPSSSTEENPVVVYSEAGTYSVTLVSTNGPFTSEATVEELIVVNDVPDASFNYTFDMLTASFSNTTSNADSYSWDFGDGGISTEENPEHTYNAVGDYNVILTATNECGDSEFSFEVSVSSLPTANFGSNVDNGCTVAEIQFEDLSSSNVDSWSWTFEGGEPSTSSEQNPVVSYENEGVFDVSLTVTNESGSHTYELEDYITINTLPSIVVTENMDGNTVMFNAESDNTDEYLWTVLATGDEYFGSSPNITFPADGVFTVELEASNECGTVSLTTAVNITAYPNANFESNFTEGCAPAFIEFMDNSTDSPTSFEWSFPGGTPSSSIDENPIIEYMMSGSYDVQLIAENQYGKDTVLMVQHINLTQGPVADFEYVINGGSIDFTNTSTGEGQVKWDFGDGTTTEEENPSHTYEFTGDYVITLVIDNGPNCTDTLEQLLSVMVSNEDYLLDLSHNLYPNPNNGSFTLELAGVNSSIINYDIVNIVGQKLQSGILRSEDGNIKESFGLELTPGLYFIKIESESRQQVIRFIIQ